MDGIASDFETTSWSKVERKFEVGKSRAASAVARDPKLDGAFKRGVAFVKNPERRGRKRKRVVAHIG